jgi:coenzyme PQQ biosynthesis protein PqqD
MKLGLRKKARLIRRAQTGRPLLVYPERALELNDSAAQIVSLLDGTRSLPEIASALGDCYPGEPPERIRKAVERLLGELGARHLIEQRP